MSEASGAGHGGPARGYSWAPFEAGNTIRLVHGAYSPRTIAPLADELAAGLLAERPDLRAFALAVAAWARAETIAAMLHLFLDERGVTDDDGEPRERILRELRAHERLAGEHRARLGLDPRSSVALARERLEAVRDAIDVEAVQARGVAALGRRGLLAVGGDDDEPPAA